MSEKEDVHTPEFLARISDGDPDGAREIKMAGEFGAFEASDYEDLEDDEGDTDDDEWAEKTTMKPTGDTLAKRLARAWDALWARDKPNPEWEALWTKDQYQPPVPTHGNRVIAGLVIHIENPAGTQRKPHYPVLAAHYGEILGTESADGDPVDVFVKEGTYDDYSGPVFVIDQPKQDGSFDEHKVMLGWGTLEEATSAYLSAYQVGWEVGPITQMTLDELKAWLDHQNRKPVGGAHQ